MQKTFAESDCSCYMKQILSAVAYCHAHKIVHRDLKRENILFETMEEDAHLIVIDFGTSQFYNSSKVMTAKVGTPYYIAPERLGQSYNEKCHIWSCGIIMYVLLTGRMPYSGKQKDEVLMHVMSHSICYNISEIILF